MKIRNLMLGSIATLVAATAFAAPSFAQNSNRPSQVSSPAEQAQTETLNSESGNNGSQVSDNATPSAQDQYQTQLQQYQEQQQQHQQDQRTYQMQRDRYERDHANYENNIHHYDDARFSFADYPSARPYGYERESSVRLYLIAEPSQQLTNAPVEGPSGEWIGKVRSIETGVDGRPARVEIALNRRVSVWVDPGDLRFDASDHIVFSHLTRADLWDMPGATYESASY